MTDFEDDQNFEDEVRAAMRAHEHEAPDVSDFLARRPDPSPSRGAALSRWVPAVAAAVVVLGVALGVVLTRSSGDPSPTAAGLSSPSSTQTSRPPDASSTSTGESGSPGLSCPARFDARGKSADKATGEQTLPLSTQLVPAGTPSSAIVCAYLHDGNGALTGSKTLANPAVSAAKLAALPAKNPNARVFCPTYATVTDEDNYVVGFALKSGIAWVTVLGNHCDGTTNGTFLTASNQRAEAAQAFTTGRWPA